MNDFNQSSTQTVTNYSKINWIDTKMLTTFRLNIKTYIFRLSLAYVNPD